MTQSRWLEFARMAILGLAVSVLGLTLAGSLGHRFALAMGTPHEWFEVDFNHASAIWLAVALEVSFVSLGYSFLGLFIATSKACHPSVWAAANPVVGMASVVAYKALKPLEPEHAYYSPESMFLVALAFPIFFLSASLVKKIATSGAEATT